MLNKHTWKTRERGGGSDYVALSRVLQGNGDEYFYYFWYLEHLNVLRRDAKKKKKDNINYLLRMYLNFVLQKHK